jgi:Ca-activated chloride channel family protein
VTPRLARAIVIAAAAVAVLVAAADRWNERARADDPELVLRYFYSPDAQDLLAPLIDRFNGESHRSGGREIRIDGVSVTSGEAEAALAARREQAALWTPASSLWGGLLNHNVSANWVPAENPRLVYSPQVIAMWKPFAQALGWPKSKIGWSDILALTTSKRGWAARGHPGYGKFKLGHTNPGFSTSGLSAVASEYYAVTGKRSGLSLADVRRPDVRAAVRRIERSIVHYGVTARELTEKMDLYGRPYVHVAYTQETTVREFDRLVRITPADGTFVADYPLIALTAPWVSPSERAAAETFRRWLVPRITPENAAESGFHIRRPTGLVELEPPEPEVLAAIQDAWHEDRPPANIVLVVDTSSSMARGGRLEAAQQGLLSFLEELSPEDRVALVTSGNPTRPSVRLGAPKSRASVSRAVRELDANGDEPVYPAVSRALDDVRRLNDRQRINAVVVLSDGAGKNVGRKQLLRKIAEEPVTEGTGVRIFTVAYGKQADAKALRQLASESDGTFFPAGPKDIKNVYEEISSHF